MHIEAYLSKDSWVVMQVGVCGSWRAPQRHATFVTAWVHSTSQAIALAGNPGWEMAKRLAF